MGRHAAFSERLGQSVPPVASALGTTAGAPLIYFLAARESARTIENPRQIPAYRYPPLYGPSSPSFSRASLHGENVLFIAGTASIVGHESRHDGDLTAQIDETLHNIAVLISEVEGAGYRAGNGVWQLKIYLRHADHLAVARERLQGVFPDPHQIIYLRADICRAELLIEIEPTCVRSTL